jgi:hypothetical protein
MKRLQVSLFIALVLAYVATRVWHLTDSCLWFDEIFSVHAAEHAWGEILDFIALDLIHPPLFYILLKMWIALGGEGLLWLRLFPVLFSMAALLPLIAIFRELELSMLARSITLFLLTVSGSLIKYSQELRMYSLLFFLSLVSLWMLFRLIRTNSGFLPFGLVNLLLIYTHYFGWFFVVGESIAFLIFLPRVRSRLAIMVGALAIAFSPWAIYVIARSSQGQGLAQNIGGTARPGAREFATFLLGLVQPFYFQVTTAEPSSNYYVSIPILVAALTCLTAYAFTWHSRTSPERKTTAVLSMVCVLVVGLAFIGSWLLTYSFWGTRHMIVVFAPVCLLVAIAINALPSGSPRAVMVGFLVLLASAGFYQSEFRSGLPPSWCAWAPLADEAVSTQAANLYAVEDLIAYHIWFAEKGNTASRRAIVKLDDIQGVHEDRGFFLPRGFDEVKTINIDALAETRFWLFFRTNDLNDPSPVQVLENRGYHVKDRRVLPCAGELAQAVLLEKQL